MTIRLPPHVDARRSAAKPIYGYLYQTYLGVNRWLDLKNNEAVWFEGNEDIDRIVLDKDVVKCEQVKTLGGSISSSDRSIKASLSNFAVTFSELRQAKFRPFFVFTTTAQLASASSAGHKGLLLAEWGCRPKRKENADRARALLWNEAKATTKAQSMQAKEKLLAALQWFDSRPGRWAEFVRSIQWDFEASDIPSLRDQITAKVAARPGLSGPADLLAAQLVVEAFLASSHSNPQERARTSADLDGVLTGRQPLHTEHRWQKRTENLKEILDDTLRIRRFLKDPRQLIPEEILLQRPGHLLTADYEIVPFNQKARRAELKRLADWCHQPTPKRSAMLVHGEGGAGKTRLLIEWCARLRDHGWHAGFLDLEREQQDLNTLAPLYEGTVPRLIVIDYAAPYSEAVQRLLRDLAGWQEGPRLRLALLTRDIPDWLTQKENESLAFQRLLLKPSENIALTGFIPPGPPRTKAFEQAVSSFARALKTKRPARTPRPNLSELDSALYLHMTALATVYGDRPEQLEDPLKSILQHEFHIWFRAIRASNIPAMDQKYLKRAVPKTLAILTLFRELRFQEARLVLEGAGLNYLGTSDFMPQLLSTLHQLTGRGGGDDVTLSGLKPDLLGERLIENVLKEDPHFLTKTFDLGAFGASLGAASVQRYLEVTLRILQRRLGPVHQEVLDHDLRWPAPQEVLDQALRWIVDGVAVAMHRKSRRRSATGPWRAEAALPILSEPYSALTQLARLAKRDAMGERFLRAALSQRPSLVSNALTVAIETGGPISQILAEVIEENASKDLLKKVAQQLDQVSYRQSANLWEVAYVVILRLLSFYNPSTRPIEELGRLQNNLAVCCYSLKRNEEALAAADSAVTIYRALEYQDTRQPPQKLSTCLLNRGAILAALGDLDQSLVTTGQAVDLLRSRAASEPTEENLTELARGRLNQGTQFFNLGRRKDALSAISEAVEILRRQVQAGVTPWARRDLSLGLNHLGVIHRSRGNLDISLSFFKEALELRRDIAMMTDDYTEVANILRRLGDTFIALQHQEDGAAALAEAGRIQPSPVPQLPGSRMESNGQTSADPEARLRDLTKYFAQEPVAFAQKMESHVTTYLQDVQRNAGTPDHGLLLSIVQAAEKALVAQPSAHEILHS